MKIKKKWLVIFLLPATLIFALVYAVPVVMLTATSFTDWVAVSSPHFNGIDNYIKLFQNSQFLHATVNTLIWMVLQSTVHIFIGVLTALILARKKVLLEIYAYRLHVPQYYFQRGNRYAVRYAFESFLRNRE